MNGIGLVRQTLIADQSINFIAGQRIYFNAAPINSSYPLIILTPIAEVPNSTLTGEARNVTRERIQVDCWASTYQDICGINEAVVSAMESLRTVCLARDFSADEKRNLYRYMNDYSVWIDN